MKTLISAIALLTVIASPALALDAQEQMLSNPQGNWPSYSSPLHHSYAHARHADSARQHERLTHRR